METRALSTATVPEPEVPAPDRDTCPATIAQLSLWFVDQLIPDAPIYNMPRAFRIQGPLDRGALAQALSGIVARHEALRTTFVGVEGRAHQVINPAVPVVPRLIDVSATPESTRLDAAVRLAIAEADRPFDLATGPLFRTCLISLGSEDHILVVTMHHIVADGWSLVVLSRELSAGYANLTSGRGAGLPLPALQLGDYATWEAEQSATAPFQDQLGYWRERLVDAPPVIGLLPDRHRAGPPTYAAGTVELRVDADVVDALRRLAGDEHTTLFMTTLTVFLVLLGRYARSDDVVVGVPVAGRRPEFEDVIGYFSNTLPVRADLSGSPTFRELLARVREICLDAFAHQDVPLAKVVEELNPTRDLTTTPVVQVLFQLIAGFGQGVTAGGDEPALAGTRVSTVDIANRHTEWQLEIQVVDSGDELDVQWTYGTDLFERSTIDALSRQFVALLTAVAADADLRVADVDVLTAGERDRIAEREAAAAQVRVLDGSGRRCPYGVPGELMIAGPTVTVTAFESPAQAAMRLVPDPYAAVPGARMLATTNRARYRRDGTIEILGPVATPAAEPVAGSTAPATPAADEVDEQVADVLAELLGVDELGADENFFDVGGHSILAIRAIIALSEKFGFELPLRAIFDAPTVAAMSELIRNGGGPREPSP